MTMIQTGTFAAVILNILICFGIPAGGLLYLIISQKKAEKAFIIGILAFFVSQIVIRIPILQYLLPKMEWYQGLQGNIWAYAFFLGITAALFEETARWAAMKWILKKERRRIDGIAFGLGHGGIEAILLVGIANINSLIYMAAMNNGTFDMLFAAVPAETAAMVKNQLLSVTPLQASMGGMERIFAIIFHISCSLIVLKGVKERRAWYFWFAVLLHMLLDTGSVLLQGVFRANVYVIEIFAALVAAGSAVLAWKLFGSVTEEVKEEVK